MAKQVRFTVLGEPKGKGREDPGSALRLAEPSHRSRQSTMRHWYIPSIWFSAKASGSRMMQCWI